MLIKVTQYDMEYFMLDGVGALTVGNIEPVTPEAKDMIAMSPGDYDLTGKNDKPQRTLYVERDGVMISVRIDTEAYIMNDSGDTIDVIRCN